MRIRLLACAAALMMCACFPAANASAGTPKPNVTLDAIVYPTGTFPTDVLNVQTAVTSGGTVLLKAADAAGVPQRFEFGMNGRVFTFTDVTILGETVAGAMTTIHGGNQPIHSAFSPVRSAVRGIHFDGPQSAAVRLFFSSGFEFSNNVVTDVIGTPFGPFTKGQAVWINEAFLGAVTGPILIANNVVERVFADLSYGVALAGFDGPVRIAGNVFRDTKDTGILVVGGSQPIAIENNVVQGGAPFPGFSSVGNGIFAGLGAGPVYIRGNTVVCDNPFADGIALAGVIDFIRVPNEVPASSVIEKNDVTMHGSLFGGITIYGEVSPSLVANNKVSGDGAYALDIVPFFGDEISAGTVFRGNNIAKFQSTVADVFLDYVARNTVLVGNAGTVIDYGAGNRITGFTHGAAHFGPQIQAAQQRKRQLMQTLGAIDSSSVAEK